MILDSATYTGPRYTYGFRNRPPGYAHNPKDFIHGTEATHSDYRHGTLDFPRPLGEDAYRYELTLVKVTLDEDHWQEFKDKAAQIWASTSKLNVYLIMESDDLAPGKDVLWVARNTAGIWKITPAYEASTWDL